eukprot:GFUD01040640.1.p1 GENE.GFUD01040640.1~~GFUD01040640.1.p1  ORF type:complete len:444 (+),score=140.61 GFUD01040640.1:76-1407(+)
MKRSHSPSPPSSPVFTKAKRTVNTGDVSRSRNDISACQDPEDFLPRTSTQILGRDLSEALTPRSPSVSSDGSVPCGQRQLSGMISSLSKQASAGNSDDASGARELISQDSWLQSSENIVETDDSQIKDGENSNPLDVAEAFTADVDELELLSQVVNEPVSPTNVSTTSNIDSVEFVPVSTLLSSTPPPLSVGCPLLDLALAGGLRRGALTEVVGESSAGKTQFCLQCALTTASMGEKVVYIVTEGGFPQARLDQMVEARGREDLRDLILVQQVKDVHHLLVVLGDQLDRVAREVALVVVDSVAATIRYDGDFTTGLLRGGMVHKVGEAMLGVALRHNMAVLAVNQVTDKIEGSKVYGYTWGRRMVASLGLAWTQYPHTRLWLTKTRLVVGRTASVLLQGLQAETRLRTMHVDWSCRLAVSTTHFVVDTKGCKGVRVVDGKSEK